MDSSESDSESLIAFDNDKDFKFVGREWLFSKLNKYMNDGLTECKNVILILGNISTGKTKVCRQLLQLSEFRDQTIAYYEVDDESDDCSFVLQLAKQLKKRIPYLNVPKYLQIEKDKQNSKDCSSNESLFDDHEVDQEDNKFFKQRKTKMDNDIFWTYFLFPLIEFGVNRWENEKYFLIIDSVDLKTEIYELICKHLHLIPKFLYLILTARPKRQPNLFQKFSESRKFQLDDLRKQYILNDMKVYVNHQLERLHFKSQIKKEYVMKKLINQLSIKSNGSYCFIKLFIDYAEKGILDLSLDLNLGCTINGLYLSVFSKLFDKDRKVQYFYRSILSLILASSNNQLSKSVLSSLFINPSHVDSALTDLEFYQLINLTYNEDGDTLINLTACSVSEWLDDVKLSGRRYFCNSNFGNILLINITPNLTHNQLCYQIDNINLPVFETEHKLIWLLLESDTQQFNLLDTLTGTSEVAKELCAYKSRLHKNNQLNFDSIYQTMFTNNLSYESFRPYDPQFNEQTLSEKSLSLLNLNKNKTTGLPISIIDQKVLSTFSRLTLKSIEPEGKDEKKICSEYDVIYLLKAIENQDLDQIKRILESNPDLVNKYADDDLTPLFYAIKTENKQIVDLLIEFNVDVNLTCEHERQTPLMLSAQLNLIEISLALLENDADIDATNLNGQTAIVYAILYKCKPRLIELFLVWGAHLDYLDNNGKSLMLLACINADANLETIRLLISYGLDIFHQDYLGKSCLHLASVHQDNYELIEYLVAIGRDELICLKDNEGKMAIMYAIIYGSPLLVPLLANERSINSTSLDGCSPLRLAALELQYDCLHTLIECGADINSLDSNGCTCLYYLASVSEDNADKLEMMKELIKLGANLELASANKTTPLHISCYKSFEKTVTLLLSAGVEVNSVDAEQRNALHLVCISTGKVSIMRKLIEHGIDFDAYTIKGKTPLMLAAERNLYDSCKLLLEYGADVWRRDEFGSNVRDIILISNNQDHKMRKLFEKYFDFSNSSDFDVSTEPPNRNSNFLHPCSPVSNMNLSSTTDLCFNVSIDKEDEANSLQAEFSRSWLDSADNLASNNCSPMQSTYNMSNMNLYNYNSNNLKNNQLGGSQHLNPKLLSPNFQRTDSDDIMMKKDKRSNSKISSISSKFSRLLH